MGDNDQQHRVQLEVAGHTAESDDRIVADDLRPPESFPSAEGTA
jgi:hypothetical protein